MTEKLTLKKQYVQVIRDSNQQVTYGGDQGFFKTDVSGSPDEKKYQTGCGIIAVTDVMLYLSGNSMAVLQEAEYRDCFAHAYSKAGKVSLRYGASGLKLARVFNLLATEKQLAYRSSWGIRGKRILPRIQEMLQADIPVVLCIPMMILKKNKKDQLNFLNPENLQKLTATNAHYVTVTGLWNKDDVLFLEISSWGKKYLIRWSEYETFMYSHFLGTILGNLLYIRGRK